MITEAEFEQYKEDTKRKSLKRGRMTATVFGVLATTALIALVYAFFQNAAAERAKLYTERAYIELAEKVKRAEQHELELMVEIQGLEARVRDLTDQLNNNAKKPSRTK